jgi:hypothetical protein
MSLACARHPWWTIAVWAVALVAAGAVYVTMGGVFTSSSRFLNEPDSKKYLDVVLVSASERLRAMSRCASATGRCCAAPTASSRAWSRR